MKGIEEDINEEYMQKFNKIQKIIDEQVWELPLNKEKIETLEKLMEEYQLVYFIKSSSFNILSDYPCMGNFESRLRYSEIEGPYELAPKVKKGMYVSAAFADARRSTDSYSLYLANILRSPSYVSSWTALQYYNLTTEVIHSTTSVSLKVTRNYVTKIGTFQYQSIDKRAFCDFQLLKSDFDFFIATPSKAIFDLLYFKTRGFRGYSRRDVLMMAEDLRIDVDELSKDELTKLYLMLKKYE